MLVLFEESFQIFNAKTGVELSKQYHVRNVVDMELVDGCYLCFVMEDGETKSGSLFSLDELFEKLEANFIEKEEQRLGFRYKLIKT